VTYYKAAGQLPLDNLTVFRFPGCRCSLFWYNPVRRRDIINVDGF